MRLMIAIFRHASFTVVVLAATLLAGCGKGAPSGSYEAKAPAGEEGTMTLEFQKDNTVKMIMTAPMGKMEFTCTFKMDGDKVLVQPPDGTGGSVLTLVPKGSGYEATENGETMVFARK